MATFDNTTFCTVTDVNSTLTGLNVVCQRPNDSTLDSYIQGKITVAKNRMLKFDLQKECQKRFPDTIQSWTRFLHQQVDDAVASNSRSVIQGQTNEILPPNSFDSYYSYLNQYSFNANYGLQPYVNVADPQVYFNSGIPDSSTLAGTAKTGSVLINTLSTDKQFPYINRGTLAAPSWSIMNATDGIDYILNPDCLINCAVYATLLLMSKDGIFANKLSYTDTAVYRFATSSEAMFAEWYDEAKHGRLSEDKKKRIDEGDFSLIAWDIDGDGVVSNYEKSVNVENSNAPAIW